MKKEITAKDFGRFGGQALKKKYGREHFVKLAEKRWARRKALKKPSIGKGGTKK